MLVCSPCILCENVCFNQAGFVCHLNKQYTKKFLEAAILSKSVKPNSLNTWKSL